MPFSAICFRVMPLSEMPFRVMPFSRMTFSVISQFSRDAFHRDVSCNDYLFGRLGAIGVIQN